MHPGSGSQRPRILNNRLEDNDLGLFWCWGVKFGLAEGNWIDMAPDHLEASIRMDPKGDYARAAFDLLKEVLTEGYAGAEEADLPTDVWLRIVTLRQQCDNAVRKVRLNFSGQPHLANSGGENLANVRPQREIELDTEAISPR